MGETIAISGMFAGTVALWILSCYWMEKIENKLKEKKAQEQSNKNN